MNHCKLGCGTRLQLCSVHHRWSGGERGAARDERGTQKALDSNSARRMRRDSTQYQPSRAPKIFHSSVIKNLHSKPMHNLLNLSFVFIHVCHSSVVSSMNSLLHRMLFLNFTVAKIQSC